MTIQDAREALFSYAYEVPDSRTRRKSMQLIAQMTPFDDYEKKILSGEFDQVICEDLEIY